MRRKKLPKDSNLSPPVEETFRMERRKELFYSVQDEERTAKITRTDKVFVCCVPHSFICRRRMKFNYPWRN